MSTASFSVHGGRVQEARALFPQAPEPWVDLSTGINPRAYPAPRSNHSQRNRLPGREELQGLERVAATAFGVDDPSRVVATAGSEAALRLLPRLLNLRHAIIATPTYSSHAESWESTSSVSVEHLLTHDFSERVGVVIVNPNNPDGRIVDTGTLQSIHDGLARHGGTLIVDEAFVDLIPAHSVAAMAGASSAPRLIVLRSFGKFYGLAGLRLGFLVADTSIAAALRRWLGDWPVSVDAMVAGTAAYADSAWGERERERLRREAQRLDQLLIAAGFSIVGGTSLYRLARSPQAQRLFNKLLAAGILSRPFSSDATLLRFGLPKDAPAWRRLASALTAT